MMRTVAEADRDAIETALDSFLAAERPLLVGVLPHPFCNPEIKGCGFCTFPHESFSNPLARTVAACVETEIESFAAQYCRSGPRRVEALYFGGGTANLTPPDAFASLCRTASSAFDLAEAEVTLEGVPRYFTARTPSLLDILRDCVPARTVRISMGIQTFDAERLRSMGRTAFGDGETFRGVVDRCRVLGIGASGDLLVNLPGQSLDAMHRDVRQAIDLGLDQVCVYHLVLFDGLGTEWSKDEAMLAALPGNERACDNWLALRETLLAQGFVQTTLTNFERADAHAGPRRFRYEPLGFEPEAHDVVGFGPSALSLLCDAEFRSAVKVVNPDGSADYLAAVDSGRRAGRWFTFDARDMRVLYLTRKLAGLAVNRNAYRAIFGTDVLADFPLEFDEIASRNLVAIDDASVALTPRGMFYADTVAGMIAWRRSRLHGFRERARGRVPSAPTRLTQQDVDDARFDGMG